MDFWDTIRGHHLADTLIRTLPKLADKADGKTEQYTELLTGLYEAMDYVAKEIAGGNKYVGHLTSGENDGFLVIMERKVI